MADSSDRNGTDCLYDRPYDGAPSYAVVSAVAAVSGRSPQDVEPLAETIDPDALDNFLTGSPDVNTAVVCFRYAGYEVTATTEKIQITQPD